MSFVRELIDCIEPLGGQNSRVWAEIKSNRYSIGNSVTHAALTLHTFSCCPSRCTQVLKEHIKDSEEHKKATKKREIYMQQLDDINEAISKRVLAKLAAEDSKRRMRLQDIKEKTKAKALELWSHRATNEANAH